MAQEKRLTTSQRSSLLHNTLCQNGKDCPIDPRAQPTVFCQIWAAVPSYGLGTHGLRPRKAKVQLTDWTGLKLATLELKIEGNVEVAVMRQRTTIEIKASETAQTMLGFQAIL